MNHCPVYATVGGHAYGWVYPGPMGAVLTPTLVGVDEAGHLPNASTFCGKCESVCPMKIPLPKMMRHWREREFEMQLSPATYRYGLKFWAFFATRPQLYRLVAGLGARLLGMMGGSRGRFRSLPLAGGWTQGRDMPAPEGTTIGKRCVTLPGARNWNSMVTKPVVPGIPARGTLTPRLGIVNVCGVTMGLTT